MRKQQIEIADEKQQEKDKQIPGYGNQTDITPDSKNKTKSKQQTMKDEMEALEAETKEILQD